LGAAPDTAEGSGTPRPRSRAKSTKNPWNSLEIAKFAASLITPLAVVYIGYLITNATHNADTRNAEQVQSREAIQARQVGVIALSQFIYERRVRAELLASSLKRNAVNLTTDAKEEMIERKRKYDEAYANWNTNAQANLFRVRATLQANTYTYFEDIFEKRLIGSYFNPLDACLTNAYDVAIKNGDPRPTLDACNTRDLLQKVLDCGYAITNDLYGASSILSGDAASDVKIRDDVNEQCNR
jgi:hypothetical protein